MQEGADMTGVSSTRKMGWVVVGDGEAFPWGRGGVGAGGGNGWWRHGGKPENTHAVRGGSCLARGDLVRYLQIADVTTVQTEIKCN